MSEFKVDAYELARWNSANLLARAEYIRRPVLSGPYCEWCRQTSTTSPCRHCAKETP